jgi:hypothetical protein
MKPLLLLTIPVIFLLSGCTQFLPNTVGDKPSSFNITPAEVISSSYNPGTIFTNSNFTVPVVACSVSRVIRNCDNTTWRDPRMSFRIEPIPGPGQGLNDYSTIYFSVKGYDRQIAGKTIIEFSGNEYQVVFRDSSYSWLISGYQRIKYGETSTLTLDLFVNPIPFSYLLPGETQDLTLTFSNSDNTWKATYLIRFIVIRSEPI